MALINKYKLHFFRPACDPQSEHIAVFAEIDADISELFPYLNALIRAGRYFPNIPCFRFRFQNKYPAILYSRRIGLARLWDQKEAERVIKELCDFLNQVWEKRAEINPDYEGRPAPSALEIYKYLPKTNCKRCGQEGCMAFAVLVSNGEAEPEDCPELYEKEEFAFQRKELEKLLGLSQEQKAQSKSC